MAGKRKRSRRNKGGLFLATLFLTISTGCVVLLAGWAIAGTQTPQLAAVRVESQMAAMNAGVSQAGENGDLAKEAAGEAETDGAADRAPGKYDALLADEELCRQQNVYAKETADPEEISIVFAGDILFDDHYAPMAKLLQRGKGIEGSISPETLDAMRSADIFVVNNEFPYTDRGAPTEGKTFTFRAKPEYASLLLDMGADLVSLANNHAYDYGEVSLTDSLDTLSGIGMPWMGAGRNLEEAIRPVYFIANDRKIAFIAATQIERIENPDTKGATETSPGVFRCLDPERLLAVVRNASQVSDYVIVFIHWGTEGTDELDWAQKDQAPKIAEAGADLIIGAHPHVLQPLGYCGDTPVVYSLGNFLFNSKPLDSCLVRLTLDENGLKGLQFLPARQEDCSVKLLEGGEKERVLQYMRDISDGVAIDAEGFVTKG